MVSGWYGSPSSAWENPHVACIVALEQYGNVRDPRLPGAGGGGNWCIGAVYTGAPGGGVARIDVSTGVVRLEGDFARTAATPVRWRRRWIGAVVADRLEGGGLITADGDVRHPQRDTAGAVVVAASR